MDRRERSSTLETAILAALQGWQAGLWTALPVEIVSFDKDAETVTAQPTIQAKVRDRLGVESWVNLPVLVDVPVVFPGGGGFTLTFPIKPGDEALVVFASRCIDAWWQSGGVQQQAELRMHDLSDGFALVGLKSQPRTLEGGVNTVGAQLRSDDGQTYVEVDAEAVKVITPGAVSVECDQLDATAATSASVSAPSIALVGNVAITGNLTVSGNAAVGGNLTNDGTNVGKTHTHSGVQPGGGNTGAPN